MKSITVYDPPMCCSTGVCGPEVDPVLTQVSGMLAQLSKLGVKVERYNLAQQPMAFAQNPEVRALLDKDGAECLPLFYIDGQVLLKGRYPEAEERSAWIKQVEHAANLPAD
jgi:hypothetical protein